MKTIKKLFPLILLLVIESITGQENDFKIIYEKENCAKKSELILTPLYGTFKPVEYNDLYNPSLSSLSSAETDGGIFDKALEIEKQKVTKEKKEFQSSELLENQSNKKTEINTISIRQKFEAGITASCPPDNTLAISKDGKIFSGSNSGVRIYTESGLLLKSWTLLNFVNNSDLKNLCDPKVMYDDIEDRFIFYTQTCDWPKPSSVVVAFSKTNDPAGDWWVYTLTGDPGGNLVVFDYPKMAITAHEILITGNLFTSSGTNFDESVIYQINKHDGYDGKTINWQFWNGIEGTPFTILPLRNGLGGNYGNVCHFVSMRSSIGNSINVYTLTDQMSAPNEVLNLKKITITNYTVMGNSSQSGTNTELHTGDCRVLDGYFQNPMIHFVNTVSGSGWGVVRYYRYNFNTLEGSFKTISDIGSKDNVYASVSPLTNSTSNHASFVNYLSSGTSIFPEIRGKYFDHSFNSTNSFLIRQGEGNNTICFDSNKNASRWGDYTGSCIRVNSAVPTIWISGCYGSNANRWHSYIAEITDSFPENIPVSVSSIENSNHTKIFPNPAVEKINIEFTSNKIQKMNFNIIDSKGQMIDHIMNAYVNHGINTFSFETQNLPKGIYFLNISNDQKIIKHEKFVVH